jgi:hypothetical protein
MSLLYAPAPCLHSLSSEKLELLRATAGQRDAEPYPKRALPIGTLTLVVGGGDSNPPPPA